MSIEAVALALKSSITKSTKKFVLVCLANYSDEHGRCWPALSTLSRDTAQDIKTVRANVRELCDEGFLEDTGKRVGQTQSVVVYRLRLGRSTNIGTLDSGADEDSSTTKNGSANPTNIGTAKGTEIGTSSDVKPYQKREGNPTKNGSEALPKLVGDPSWIRQGTVSGDTTPQKPKRKRTPKPPRPDTEFPEDFRLTPERQQYAEKHLPNVDAVALFETFENNAKAKRWIYADWNAHWQTLVRQWAPNSGHWSSCKYPCKPTSNGQRPMFDPKTGEEVRW